MARPTLRLVSVIGGVTVIENEFDETGAPRLSTAVKVIGDETPTDVGIPEIAPVEAFDIDIPTGKTPVYQ